MKHETIRGSDIPQSIASLFGPALRNLEREEQQYQVKLAAPRTAVDEGDASGVAMGNVFARVRKTIKLSAPPR